MQNNDNLYSNNSPHSDDIFPLREDDEPSCNSSDKNNKEDFGQNFDNPSSKLKSVFNKILSGDLFEDENILIIILLIIISKNHKDKKLILALCYLLL